MPSGEYQGEKCSPPTLPPPPTENRIKAQAVGACLGCFLQDDCPAGATGTDFLNSWRSASLWCVRKAHRAEASSRCLLVSGPSIPMPDFPHYSWSSFADADGWCSHGWFLEVLEKELWSLLGCSWGTKAYPKLLFRLGSMLGYPKIAEISCHCTTERSSLQTSRCFALLLTKLVVLLFRFIYFF